jgi:hypothetical protein
MIVKRVMDVDNTRKAADRGKPYWKLCMAGCKSNISFRNYFRAKSSVQHQTIILTIDSLQLVDSYCELPHVSIFSGLQLSNWRKTSGARTMHFIAGFSYRYLLFSALCYGYLLSLITVWLRQPVWLIVTHILFKYSHRLFFRNGLHDLHIWIPLFISKLPLRNYILYGCIYKLYCDHLCHRYVLLLQRNCSL